MRFERTTSRVGVWHSIQLSYGRIGERMIKEAVPLIYDGSILLLIYYWLFDESTDCTIHRFNILKRSTDLYLMGWSNDHSAIFE